MIKLVGTLNLEKYIDKETIASLKTSARRELTHEFELWDMIPETLQKYVTACAIVDAIKEVIINQSVQKPEILNPSDTVDTKIENG